MYYARYYRKSSQIYDINFGHLSIYKTKKTIMYQLKALHNFPNSSFSSEVYIHLISRLSHQTSNRALNANRGQEFSKNSQNQIVAAIELMS